MGYKVFCDICKHEYANGVVMLNTGMLIDSDKEMYNFILKNIKPKDICHDCFNKIKERIKQALSQILI